jgi:hypothetical protein
MDRSDIVIIERELDLVVMTMKAWASAKFKFNANRIHRYSFMDGLSYFAWGPPGETTSGWLTTAMRIDFRLWPFSEVATGLADVRLLRHGGLDLLRLSSSPYDPQRTLMAWPSADPLGG